MVRSGFLLAALVAASVLGVAPSAACPNDDSHESASGVGQVSVAQVAELLKQGKATALDANNDATRAKFGVIPGAVLLASFSGYPLEQLPADKHVTLVFYCANPRCSASHSAAQRAVDAGYLDVAVMPDGIMGWKQAGHPTAPMAKS